MAQKEHQGWSGKDLSRVENSAGLCGAPTHQMLFSLVNLTPKEQRIIWKGTEVIQETQLETWNRSASGKRRDCDFELQGLGRKWCLHCNSQMLWRWRENKCSLPLRSRFTNRMKHFSTQFLVQLWNSMLHDVVEAKAK